MRRQAQSTPGLMNFCPDSAIVSLNPLKHSG
jgi:hypothetical protein